MTIEERIQRLETILAEVFTLISQDLTKISYNQRAYYDGDSDAAKRLTQLATELSTVKSINGVF